MGLILVQMRQSIRSLAGVSLAIVLGVAFVTCTLIAGAVIERSAWNSVAAQFDGADAIVTTTSAEAALTDDTVERVSAVDGVASAEGRLMAFVDASAGSRVAYPAVSSVPNAPAVRDELTLADGRLPAASGEVALLTGVAEQLQVGVGDSLSFQVFSEETPAAVFVTVVGLIDGPSAVAGTGSPGIYAPSEDVAGWSYESTFSSVLVVAEAGTTPDQLVGRLNGALDQPAIARTRDQQAAFLVADITGQTDVLSIGLLAFAVIALLVAGMVIANTFAILVAQRTRNLALLRCVGATRGQIRRSVLTEAAILGTVASVAGVLLGIVTITIGVRVFSTFDSTAVVATDTPIPLTAIVVPLVLGIIATLAAA